MLDGVIETIEKYKMLSQYDVVVVAVSGGPDSMALLHILYSLKDKYHLTIHAAHLNHMLRGREADEDTKYVEEYCKSLNIPCTVKYVDIKKMSRDEKLSLEEAGRKARYQLFNDVAEEIKATKIALAHNMNDQAETLLMRIMRGTGLDGLCGIKPVRDGLYIRPLIHTIRADIEKYNMENNIKPRIDSSNLETLYTRNKIRLELVPYIKEHFNASIEHSLSSMAEILSEDNSYIDDAAEKALSLMVVRKRGKIFFNIDDFRKQHKAIKKRLVRKAIEAVKGNIVGIEGRHIDLLMEIAEENRTGAAVELPGGITARCSFGKIEILKQGESSGGISRRILVIPGSTDIPEIEAEIETSIIDAFHSPEHGSAHWGSLMDASGFQSGRAFKSDSQYIKYLDYDKIKDQLCVRSRQEGDYIVPLGMEGKKKLKELFIDCKVPKDERDMIPVVAAGSEILWVAGYKISNNYKIDKNTKKLLKLELKQSGGKKYV